MTHAFRHRLGLSALAFAALASSTACIDLEQQQNLTDLRILGMSVEPPEVRYSPLFLDSLVPAQPGMEPPDLSFLLEDVDVRVEVFAFDPRGGLVDTVTHACPPAIAATDQGCLVWNADSPTDATPALFVPQDERRNADDARSAAGLIDGFGYDATVPVATIKQVVGGSAASSALSLLLPSYLHFNAEVATTGENTESERAFKRLPFNFDTREPQLPPVLPPDVAAQLLAGFEQLRVATAEAVGSRVCTPDEELDVPTENGLAVCVRRQGPNRSPNLVGLSVSNEDEEPEHGLNEVDAPDDAPLLPMTTVTVPIADTKVPGGKVLWVEPVFETGAREYYQFFSLNLNDRTITVEDRIEALHAQHHVTGGILRGPPSSSLQTTGHLATPWQLPGDRAAGDTDSLVMVVRDQRGAMRVAELKVVYE